LLLQQIEVENNTRILMEPDRRPTSSLVLLGLILSGCTASFEPRLSSHELTQKGLAAFKVTQLELEVPVATEAPAAGQDFRQQAPWERFNEESFRNTRQFNGSPPKPVTTWDDSILLDPRRISARNAFDNLDVMRRLTNNLLQFEFAGTGREVARFAINSTIGVWGLFDVAGDGFGIEQSDQGDWGMLKWMEKPARNSPSTLVKPQDRTDFVKVLSFDHHAHDGETWRAVRKNVKEGDVIAYKMEKWEARRGIFLKMGLNKIGYRLFKYGHMAIVVRDPDDAGSLRLLSSEAFRGPNILEDIDALKYHSWDSYRLNQWDRVDKKRFHEFISLVRQKAEHWYGYDFLGMFGLWNSNLQPTRPEDIGYSYICSTVVVAALNYAGVQLDVSQRQGIADIVTPLQLVMSRGRTVSPQTFISPGDTVEVSGYERDDDPSGQGSRDEAQRRIGHHQPTRQDHRGESEPGSL
jgi:hypothetical protein